MKINGQCRSNHHLQRYGHKGNKQANEKGTRDGTAIEVQQVWILQQRTKNFIKVGVPTILVRVW